MTKMIGGNGRDGGVRYRMNRRPIPLDLLTLVSFSDQPTQKGTGILGALSRGNRETNVVTSPDGNESRMVYPFTIYYNGRQGGPIILYAESAQLRSEWKQKLDEAMGLRRAVQESNKVFELETLSMDTFLVSPAGPGGQSAAWTQENSFTGKVTCSVPFSEYIFQYSWIAANML
jgi:RHO1 GDP-GTP exchange protein 1/2